VPPPGRTSISAAVARTLAIVPEETVQSTRQVNGGAQVPEGDVPPEIGEQLRAARVARGLGVRELSRRIGVSASTVSQIERGNVMPSVAVLYRYVNELRISMDDLFEMDVSDSAPRSSHPTPVQRGAERPVVQLASGVRWERLSNVADPSIEYLLSVYEPGGESCPVDGLLRHGGKEFGYVQSGRIGVTVGFDTYELGAGDSISFASENPHRMFTIGDEPATVLWVVAGRHGDPRQPAKPGDDD
jgi:transcriptional regulator with XRE-family HTH domain